MGWIIRFRAQQVLLIGNWGLFPQGYCGWDMRLSAVYPPPPDAMLKNEWNYTSAPPVCHHSVLTGLTLPSDLYCFTHEKLLIFLQIEFQIFCQLLYVVGWHIGRSFTEKESIQGTNG